MERKEALKRDMGIYIGGLILYSFILYMCYDGMQYIKGITERSGIPYLVSVTLGSLLLVKFYEGIERESIVTVHKKMNLGVFIQVFFVFMGMQLVFDVWGAALDTLLHTVGLSIQDEMNAASNPSTTVSMFLYTSLFAPVTEEMIFRGLILKGLKKYGKSIAIVTSAILFGVFHANFVQGVFAIGIGLVLGYVAMEYSILWAIVLHILNNFVFSELLSYSTRNMDQIIKGQVMDGLNISFFVIGALILLYHCKQIERYLWRNRMLPYRAAVTNVWMAVYVALATVVALAGLNRL